MRKNYNPISLCFSYILKNKNIYLKALEALKIICLERNPDWEPKVITRDFETVHIVAIQEFFRHI